MWEGLQVKYISHICISVFVLVFLSGNQSFALNRYTIKNNSCVEMKINAWFTHAVATARQAVYGDHETGWPGLPLNSLSASDFHFLLLPGEQHTFTDQEGPIALDECLAYLVIEYRFIPSIVPAITQSTGANVRSGDLYLVGKRFWAQALPGLCGNNTLELNYDPALPVKFTLKVNGVHEYLQDVAKIS